MAQLDWSFLTGGLSPGVVDRGVTAAPVKPNGGGSFVFGFASKQVVTGAVGLFANQVNFAPATAGGSVRAAMKRALSGGPTGFAPMIFVGFQGTSVTDQGYLLGLQDDNPSHICLKKGSLSSNLEAGSADPDGTGILRVSTDTVEVDEWVHIRLDMIVNGSGDVVLRCYQNDLSANTVSAPVWESIAGMDLFIDDALGINTGSAPFTSGYMGKGFYTENVSRRAFFDHFEPLRQI